MITPKKTVSTLSLTLAALLLSNSAHAATKSISAEEFTESNGQSFWQANVECEGSAQIKLIQSSIDADTWCFSAQPNTCFATKLVAAKKVCDASTQTVEIAPATPQKAVVTSSPDVNSEEDDDIGNDDSIYDFDELRAEKNTLQDQRLKIQQEKLSLRKREIELQKRELELGN